MHITLAQHIHAPIGLAWNELSCLERHQEWMGDVVEIVFHSASKRGEGAQFSARTVVGPFATTDEMTITGWVEGSSIEVAHTGLVIGNGVLALSSTPGGSLLTWDEELQFPLRLGGGAGAILARPFMSRVWRRSLAAFARIVERANA